MTTRQLLLLMSALVAAASLTNRAQANEPAVVAPIAAIAEYSLSTATLTPSEAELKRIRNELRSELHGTLKATLGASFETSLDDSQIIAD